MKRVMNRKSKSGKKEKAKICDNTLITFFCVLNEITPVQ